MKGIDYDAWLEKPYQDMCAAADAYEAACNRYEEMDRFEEDFAEWLAEQETADGRELSVDDYRESGAYQSVVEALEAAEDYDYEPEPDYDDYVDQAEAAFQRSIDRARGYDC